jgi:two-component system, NarL family, response regulator LiaR
VTESMLIRVLIVDDHPVVRNGLRFSLFAYEDMEVVGEAGSGEEAVDLCVQLHPDVVLMDLVMPGINGVETTRALRGACPQTHVLALTSFQEGDLVQQALRAGAVGYLLKDMSIDELARAIRLAAQGLPTLAPAAGKALAQTTIQTPKIGDDLTKREREVLALLVEGLPNQQIAERLVISTATVKFHISSIRSRLGASSRTEAVALAVHHKLLKAPTGAAS